MVPRLWKRIRQPCPGRRSNQHAGHRLNLRHDPPTNPSHTQRSHGHIRPHRCRLPAAKSGPQSSTTHGRRKPHRIPGRTYHTHRRSHNNENGVEQRHQHGRRPISMPRHQELLSGHTNGPIRIHENATQYFPSSNNRSIQSQRTCKKWIRLPRNPQSNLRPPTSGNPRKQAALPTTMPTRILRSLSLIHI